MDFYVYAHVRLDSNEIFYIGKGRGKRAYARDNRNRYWHNIVNSVGYTVKFLAINLTEEDAFRKEIDLIQSFKMLGQCTTNFCPGGKGSAGYKWTEDQRKRFSESQKGRPGRALGYKWTTEQRKKLSDVQTGKKLTEGHRKKISEASRGKSNAFFGKTHSDETRQKISQHHKDKRLFAGENNPAARSVVDLRSGIIYKTIREAAATTKLYWITISRHCRGLVRSPRFKYGN